MKKGGTNKINKRLKNKGLHLYIENEFFVKKALLFHSTQTSSHSTNRIPFSTFLLNIALSTIISFLFMY